MFKDSVILVTGGTGSFGRAFIEMTLKSHHPKAIIVYSRDEMKQWEMARDYKHDVRVQFRIGDVRDTDTLRRLLKGVDYLVHAAATKIVPTSESNPFECIKTNIHGAMSIIDAASECGVKKVVALSTDKASSPVSLYGATKMVSDKLFISANRYSLSQSNTQFSVVRYGNVMGSRGTVIPYFFSQRDKEELPITDLRMTRFMITLDETVKFVWHAFNDMLGGEIYVKKIPSMNITDIARAINEKAKHSIIGIRHGEKLHEEMVSLEDAFHTYEYPEYFKILQPLENGLHDINAIKDGIKVQDSFFYSSSNNLDWMSVEYLRDWVNKNHIFF